MSDFWKGYYTDLVWGPITIRVGLGLEGFRVYALIRDLGFR